MNVSVLAGAKRLSLKNLLWGLLLLLGACQDTVERKEPIMSVPRQIAQLRPKIGQMIMIGFNGTEPGDREVKALQQLAKKGELGGIIFFGYNLKDPDQVKALTRSFNHTETPYPLLLAIDQEGGKVQRLRAKNGFQDFMSAKQASQSSPQLRDSNYQNMAAMVHQAGFNMVLGPVVDLEYNLKDHKVSPAIGALERSYGPTPEIVYRNAQAFIKAFHHQGIITTLKHFPGHGFAQQDSHHGLVDITQTHDPTELDPFYQLIAAGQADAIMTAHLLNRHHDPDFPATLSPRILKPLLRDQGYQGVIITDCLNMGAIQQYFQFEDIIINALNADVDILLFSNNSGANINVGLNGERIPSPQLVSRIIAIIEQAVVAGRISPERIEQSYRRIVRLKQQLN